MSTVNRGWNEFVGESRQMRKLKVVIDERKENFTPETKEILLSSTRKYQHIELKLSPTSDSAFLSDLWDKAGKMWKSVHIESYGRIARDLWPIILQAIEPSVEDLSIDDEYPTRYVLSPSSGQILRGNVSSPWHAISTIRTSSNTSFA